MRNVLIFQFAQNQLQLRYLLLVGFADNHGSIDRRQHAAHVLDEFDRTRAINKGVVVAHEVGRGERGFHAHLVMSRLLAGVADRGARIDCALALDRAGAGENCF